MFTSLLVANRGEIACRVMRTAQSMGIRCIAIHSDVDAGAAHVRMADEAVSLGGATAAESYLRQDAVLEACKRTGAEAVHPGYGFLSENASFANALSDAGIAFVGPPVGAIRSMGDKIESKAIAKAAGVNVIPGYDEAIDNADEALRIAKHVGFPVMIKASAGGGGKGMRVAKNEGECQEAFERAVSEATSSFGDGRVFIERFIEQPRHIEIQVLCDSHGNAVYLGERECSVQRRHQKVLEEAPSPFLDPETRRAMGEQAITLAKAVDYTSAGTVEFIVDKDKNFFFLEMNTRLQVEHPVTEYVTGLDLVEWMLRIAAGEALDFTQDDVKLTGWAVEARLYAEDAERGFLPSIGRLRRLVMPPESRHVRVDTGVTEGGEVSMYYDPMIAKVIGQGADRATAIEALCQALDGIDIEGITHNGQFLSALLEHPRFRRGDMSTAFIEEEFADGFNAEAMGDETARMFAAVAVGLHARLQVRAAAISGRLRESPRVVPADWVACMGERRLKANWHTPDDGIDYVTVEGESFELALDWRPGTHILGATFEGRTRLFNVTRNVVGYELRHGAARSLVRVLRPRVAELDALMPEKASADTAGVVRSPMPGLLISLDVAVGDAVEPGQSLAVIEAMKMENVMRATSEGVVASIEVEAGSNLAVDEVILRYEEG